MVVRGTAAICTLFSDGRRQIAGFEMTGDTICGQMATDETSSWLEALEDCLICELDFSRQAQTLQNDTSFLNVILQVTHDRLELASRHLSTLGRLDSTERVLLFLADMAIRKNSGLEYSRPIHLCMSREDIADYLGLNAETISRILSKLKKSNLVHFQSPTDYFIPDLAAVERRLPVPINDKGAGQFFGICSHADQSREHFG